MKQLIEPIAEALKVELNQIQNTLKLLEEGNTVPFIARYRKEMTNGLDEEQILYIHNQYQYQVNLSKRKEDVLRMIEQQGKLTEEIKLEVNACLKLSQVEDIYRPYQQKRKTRATDAVAKGLQPFADWILTLPTYGNIESEAQKHLSETVLTIEDAIQGAQDIIAEKTSDKADLRWKIKESIEKYGTLICKEKKKHEDEKKVYQMYYDRKERISSIASHRTMAMDRAEKEKVITISFEYDATYLINFAIRGFTHNRNTICENIIIEAVNDGLKRLAFPSVEREIRNDLSDRAHHQSIDIFSMNVERLLSQPPLNSKMILGLDPAFRTGCKLAVIDNTGKMLKIDVIYPHAPVNKKEESKAKILNLLKSYPIEVIAIGNGTASRESESFIAEIIKENHLKLVYTIVSEAGASVYSASELARGEFPDLQVEQRSAVSIARRLMDPLSELIKIDPKSIGVGQYQHDLPANQLTERLDFVISKAVNRIGVDLNTASIELLTHISGLTKSSAKAIVTYRDTMGKFLNRKQLLKVPKLGAKSFEQAAGFLRIKDGDIELDKTPIHPESYSITKSLMKKLKITSLGNLQQLELLEQMNLDELANELKTDTYTLNDILEAIKQPLRDYRDQYDGPLLRHDILTLEDLKVGFRLEGVVRNVVDFGAFVDIGLKDDGLVHVSKMAKTRLAHPSDVVSIGDIVDVWVANIDYERHKVQLSLIEI